MQAQPDGEYKFILVYQDYCTKLVLLKPLIHKRVEEVAYVLLDIFFFLLDNLNAPSILQSDNGRKFIIYCYYLSMLVLMINLLWIYNDIQ